MIQILTLHLSNCKGKEGWSLGFSGGHADAEPEPSPTHNHVLFGFDGDCSMVVAH